MNSAGAGEQSSLSTSPTSMGLKAAGVDANDRYKDLLQL